MSHFRLLIYWLVLRFLSYFCPTTRDGRQLTVYVDGKRYNVNLAGQFSGLNTDGAYYFGE